MISSKGERGKAGKGWSGGWMGVRALCRGAKWRRDKGRGAVSRVAGGRPGAAFVPASCSTNDLPPRGLRLNQSPPVVLSPPWGNVPERNPINNIYIRDLSTKPCLSANGSPTQCRLSTASTFMPSITYTHFHHLQTTLPFFLPFL
jgi:hypothetical protein